MNKWVLGGLLIVSLGLNAWFLIHERFPSSQIASQSHSQVASVTDEKASQEKNYPLLARRIFLDNPNDVIINFNGLRTQLRQIIREASAKTGVHFEYLPTGNHIGINDREPFRRASLIKLPTVMRLFKLIEEGKMHKEDELVIKKEHLDPGYGDLWAQGPGKKITVVELIHLVLQQSDNTAFNMLRDAINEKEKIEAGSDNQILTIYDYLDIRRESDGKTLDISPQGFTSILKSLFFSSYLKYESSQEILSILSEAHKEKYLLLRSQLPESLQVAHKFGVNRDGPQQTIVTSDCGIFYVPQRPYVLCVMVNAEPEVAAPIIAQVGKKTYDYLMAVK